MSMVSARESINVSNVAEADQAAYSGNLLLISAESLAGDVKIRTSGGLIDNNPFAEDGEAKFVHTIFLEEQLDRAAFEAFAQGFDGPERIAPGDREFFVDFNAGVARSQFDPAFRKAKVVKGRATARNVRSLQRILEKMDG